MIDTLPPELVLMILGRLDLPDAARLTRTCRRLAGCWEWYLEHGQPSIEALSKVLVGAAGMHAGAHAGHIAQWVINQNQPLETAIIDRAMYRAVYETGWLPVVCAVAKTSGRDLPAFSDCRTTVHTLSSLGHLDVLRWIVDHKIEVGCRPKWDPCAGDLPRGTLSKYALSLALLNGHFDLASWCVDRMDFRWADVQQRMLWNPRHVPGDGPDPICPNARELSLMSRVCMARDVQAAQWLRAQFDPTADDVDPEHRAWFESTIDVAPTLPRRRTPKKIRFVSSPAIRYIPKDQHLQTDYGLYQDDAN